MQTVSSPPLSTAAFICIVKSRAKVHANILQRIPLHLSSRAFFHCLTAAGSQLCWESFFLQLCSIASMSLITFSTPVQGHMQGRDTANYSQTPHPKTLPLGCYSILISSLINGGFCLRKAIKEKTHSAT